MDWASLVKTSISRCGPLYTPNAEGVKDFTQYCKQDQSQACANDGVDLDDYYCCPAFCPDARKTPLHMRQER
jgi:hypothetical protein